MKQRNRNSTYYLLPLLTVGTYIFLYLPIAILILYSFNKADLSYHWTGFTTQWYKQLLFEPELLRALYNSLIVAGSSVFLSLLFSLLFVFYGERARLGNYASLFYAGALLPDIVMAVGLLSFFSLLAIPLGLLTLIVGHTIIGLAFSVPIIRSKFKEINKSITEASFDLGASDRQTFFKVIIPILSPALVSAGLLVFIVSLDDFLVSFFCAGSESQTLPLYIFSAIKLGVSPVINALSSLMLFFTSAFVLLLSLLNIRKRVF